MKMTPLLLTALMAGLSVPASAATITLNATVRDFCSSAYAAVQGCTPHQDFNNNGTGSISNAVQSTLGADGKPVYNNPTTNEDIFSGAANFNQWYRDTPGVKQTIATTLELTETSLGTYQYLNNAYFPIDGLGWGNQGNTHNYHFTMELHTTFTYQAGQVFSFAGDDDVWVFINDQRVIDLGGIHGAASQSVNLDTLNLVAGENYDFDFFFAERHLTGSNLRITTSIAFDNNVPEPGTLALAALALAGAAGTRRRNRR